MACALGIAIAFTSCEKNETTNGCDESKFEVKVDYETLKASDFLSVNVEDGYITYVIMDNDTICRATKSTVIELPRN